MSSVQSYNIYSQCQQFLLDFGFTQDGDNFTYSNLDEVEGLGDIRFAFPQVVTDASLKVLCYSLVNLLDQACDESNDSSTFNKTFDQVQSFCNFIRSIRELLSGDIVMILNQAYKIVESTHSVCRLSFKVDQQEAIIKTLQQELKDLKK